MPLVIDGGFSSYGMRFLLTTIPQSSSAFSAMTPVMPFWRTSTTTMWLSVPPKTTR